jgi:hypothetical protein
MAAAGASLSDVGAQDLLVLVVREKVVAAMRPFASLPATLTLTTKEQQLLAERGLLL